MVRTITVNYTINEFDLTTDLQGPAYVGDVVNLTVSGGTAPYTWQQSDDEVSWSTLSGASGTTYAHKVVDKTFIRVVDADGKVTNVVEIAPSIKCDPANTIVVFKEDFGTLPDVDYVAGIPDSGIPHAIGYANRSGKHFARPFVKYTPTWPRSFTPTDQKVRNQVAKMKQIPVPELIEGKKLLFVDDSIVVEMIKNEIANNPGVAGFLFDGFPRTVAQAEILDKMLAERGEKVETVISIIISDALVFERIQHRANIEGRKDDAQPEIIQNRINTYHAKTEPLIEYYTKQGKYHKIDGDGTIEAIFARIEELL